MSIMDAIEEALAGACDDLHEDALHLAAFVAAVRRKPAASRHLELVVDGPRLS